MQYLAFLSALFLIVQQPLGYWSYVSKEPNTATLFQGVWACPEGRTGNTVLFVEESPVVASLVEGDFIYAVSDGALVTYEVFAVQRFRATNGQSVYSDFIDEAGNVSSSYDLAVRMFCGHGELVIQTCFDGVNGRLFVRARIISDPLDTTSY